MGPFPTKARIASIPRTPTTVSLNEGKPKAVPGGVWKEGSNTVKVWTQRSDNDEMGFWKEHLMTHCSQCGIENHLDICYDCSCMDRSKGKFLRPCTLCERSFRTSYSWKKLCSWRCRQKRDAMWRDR